MKKNRKSAAKSNTDRKFISFFSGALGLDIGLKKSGLHCLAVNDVDRVACATIKKNKVDAHLYECDIREISPTRLQSELGIGSEELFAIVGGPPCQAFSTAGRRLGLNDERGNVFLHFVELIRVLRPKYAVFENVRGLLSAALIHRPLDQRGKANRPLTDEEKPGGALLHIITLLEEAGYSTTFTLYNTANFGVPQIRERLIFFASRDGKKVPFLTPTHDEKGLYGLPKWRTLRDAIGHLQGKDCHAGRFPEKRLRFYELLKAGQNWRDLPEHLQPIALGAAWNSGGGRTGFYRRLAWDKPSPTLVTRPTMPATDLCHPTELRPLSVEEYAAIQTFPPNYVFEGSLDDQYRQIGNAVPCEFGEAIGRHLIAFDEGKLAPTNANGKFSRYDGTDHESWRESVAMLERQYRLSTRGLFGGGVINIG
jgi:DNA (cytosine-5)-methyltransferase 1